ncbi:hypothetical protein BJ875DRAFT_415989 [Amylocarpus encephaloides]|uniref:Carrier domain-containing protein n=1 Tax=Amylocarpus encephaloides TaxID=45428 RepID=A0A9P7YS13_9HELO|nr:hypothetical protein BJ875DRAFT_415989 [Amylocarpus encephaloides]
MTKLESMEPLAIVGLSLRFPEDATSPDGLWKIMAEKRCVMTEMPRERVNMDAFYHPDKERVDTVNFRGGHFLKEDLGAFDAPFFSISPAEAESMDPQQRLMLEITYCALENAGIPIESISGTKAAVFTGSFADDFKILSLKDTERMSKYTASGNTFSILANRISWAFNLKGPSLHTDTACSSSLVALHLACQSLQSKELTMAIVGGSNIMVSIEQCLLLSNLNLVSPDSKSFSFDQRANGYGRGEGAGIVVIKRLQDAVDNGDTIRAVIRATGTNQDGRTSSLTTPSQGSQEALIRDTYKSSGLDFHTTAFVEAHGTGTAVGDPIEAAAIGNVLGKGRSPDCPLYIGAIKSNIGHLEGASGVAGLIKTVLALEKGVIPPNTNFDSVNPNIKADELHLAFPQQCTPWPVKGLRRASINSFGFGGSNAHVVLDDAFNFMGLRGIKGHHNSATTSHLIDRTFISPGVQISSSDSASTSDFDTAPKWESASGSEVIIHAVSTGFPKLLVWSTSDESGMDRLVALYADHFSRPEAISTRESTYMRDLAYTLAIRRSSLAWKSFSIAKSHLSLHDLKSMISKPVRTRSNHGLGFVFTGQGAQFAKMGCDLLSFEQFRQSLKLVEAHLLSFGCQWILLDELLKENSITNIDKPELSQTLCTAIQIAMVDLLRSFGVRPKIVIGHSSGEIAASYASGALSMKSACKVAYYRGQLASRLIQDSPTKGAMLATGLSSDKAMFYLEAAWVEFPAEDVVVACINSPRSVTLSGDEIAIDRLRTTLDRDGVFNRRLRVQVAYHSPQMAQISNVYLSMLNDLEPSDESNETQTDMISSVTNHAIPHVDLRQGKYWVRNMVSPVRFSEALTKAVSHTQSVGASHDSTKGMQQLFDLLEIGPQSALKGPIKDTLKAITLEQKVDYHSLLERNSDGINTFYNAIGRLHCLGYPVDLVKFNSECQNDTPLKVLVDLPYYPFNHSSILWHESALGKRYRLRQNPRLDLLGTPCLDSKPQEMTWRKITRVSETPWIQDHVVNESPIYPAAGFMAMVIEAAHQISNPKKSVSGYIILEAVFISPLRLNSTNEGVESVLKMRPLADEFRVNSDIEEFTISSLQEKWDVNARGKIEIQYDNEDKSLGLSLDIIRASETVQNGTKRCMQNIPKTQVYKGFDKMGLKFGPTFQTLNQIHIGEGLEASADVYPFEWKEEDGSNHVQSHVIHPITLDALLQTILVAITRGTNADMPTAVPTRIGSLWICGGGASNPNISDIKVYGTGKHTSSGGTVSTAYATDGETGETLIILEDLETTFVDSIANPEVVGKAKLCYNIGWKPDIDMANQSIIDYCRQGSLPSSLGQFYDDLSILLLHFCLTIQTKMDASKLDKNRPHFAKYIRWVDSQAASLNLDLKLKKDISSNENINSVMQRVGNANYEGKMFVEVGTSILKILEGRVDPLEVIFETDLASNYYQEMNDRLCTPLARLMEIISFKHPGMKILEIGAGTGATTNHIVNSAVIHQADDVTMTAVNTYDFTDISKSFFETARAQFTRPGTLFRFMILDISLDPVGQGFEEHSYDLVVAANVLHATEKLDVTVQNARKLLKNGGKLLLLEITKNSWASQFMFGTLPGWWLSTDNYRTSGPCISSAEWDLVLRRNGFSGTDIVVNDCDDPKTHNYSIIVSTAEEVMELRVSNPSLGPESFILIGNDKQEEENVARRLLQKLQFCGRHATKIVKLRDLPSYDFADKSCICLVELKRPVLVYLEEESFYEIRSLLTGCNDVLWVRGSRGSEENWQMIDGLSRVIRTEYEDMKFVTLAIDNSLNPETLVDNIFRISQHISKSSLDHMELEYREMDGMISINRAIAADYLDTHIQSLWETKQTTSQKLVDSPPLKLDPFMTPQLSSLVEDKINTEVRWGEIQVEVKAIGLDSSQFQSNKGSSADDLLVAYAGVVINSGEGTDLRIGERVYGLCAGIIRTFVTCNHQLLCRMPTSFSFEEACSSTYAFSVAYHALIELADLGRNQTLLIEFAADGPGLAALKLAQYIGATAYVTVDTEEQKRFLFDDHNVPENRIFNSPNSSSVQDILSITPPGVDLIFTSPSGSSKIAWVEFVSPCGHFIQMYQGGNRLPEVASARNVAMHTVDMAFISVTHPARIRKILEATWLLTRGNIIQPLAPVKVHSISNFRTALEQLSSVGNVGQTVLSLSYHDVIETTIQKRPLYMFESNATYVIAGGFGGLARSIARWMTSRGAKNLILLSRSGPKPGAPQDLVEDLTRQGICVKCPKCDICSAEQLSMVLKTYENVLPPIKGCIQGSMVLQDSSFMNMTYDQWITTIKPRVQGTWNLHSLLPKGMDFFVLLSSLTGIMGNGGQANYAAGNTYMDALAHSRIATGEKAVSLDLGWIQDQGIVAENEQLQKVLESAGFLIPISQPNLLGILDYYCNPSLELNQMNCQAIVGVASPTYSKSRGKEVHSILRRSLWRSLKLCEGQEGVTSAVTKYERKTNYEEILNNAKSHSEAAGVIEQALLEKLSISLDIPSDSIHPRKPIHTYGVDSLLAVGLRNWFKKEFRSNVSVFDIVSNSSLASVVSLVVSRSDWYLQE